MKVMALTPVDHTTPDSKAGKMTCFERVLPTGKESHTQHPSKANRVWPFFSSRMC